MADHCKHCPHPDGCPAWIGPEHGFMETNVQTGDDRLVTGCFYQVIPKLMIHVVKAANRPAAAMQSFRNDVVAGLAQMIQAMPKALPHEPRHRVVDGHKVVDDASEG